MWRQDDLFGVLDCRPTGNRMPPETGPRRGSPARITKPGPRNLPAAPLMHGTGLFNAICNLMRRRQRRHDWSAATSTPIELLDTIAASTASTRSSIVGDAFAKPILRALDAEPGRWDISSLRVIVSIGRDVVEGDQGRPAAPQRRG